MISFSSGGFVRGRPSDWALDTELERSEYLPSGVLSFITRQKRFHLCVILSVVCTVRSLFGILHLSSLSLALSGYDALLKGPMAYLAFLSKERTFRRIKKILQNRDISQVIPLKDFRGEVITWDSVRVCWWRSLLLLLLSRIRILQTPVQCTLTQYYLLFSILKIPSNISR